MRDDDEPVLAVCRALREAEASTRSREDDEGPWISVQGPLQEILRGASGDDSQEGPPEPRAFFGFLRQRFVRAGAPARFEIRDLALVASCLEGGRGALTKLDAILREEAPIALSRLVRTSHLQDDIRQAVRLKLLVSQPGAPARLVSYLGTGPLRAWLRAVLVREALNAVGRPVRETSLDEALVEASSSLGPDAELQYLRNTHRADFAEAFAWAITQLEDRDRMLLSLHVAQGLSLERIAALYKVSKATAGRWVLAGRERLLNHTRDFLAKRLSLSSDGIESLFRALESDLDVSVHRLLGIPSEKS